VGVSPLQSAYVVSQTPVAFTITVKDNDSSSCAPTTFNLSSGIPSGWTALWSTSGLALSPGGSASATLTVTSPSGTADGFYNVALSANNSAAPEFGGSGTGTYVVSTPPPLSVSVTTNQPSYSPGQLVVVTVVLLSGATPDAGASVTVTVTPPTARTLIQSGKTDSNGRFSLSYKLPKRAALGTYTVQANPPTAGTAPTQGASTSFTVR